MVQHADRRRDVSIRKKASLASDCACGVCVVCGVCGLDVCLDKVCVAPDTVAHALNYGGHPPPTLSLWTGSSGPVPVHRAKKLPLALCLWTGKTRRHGRQCLEEGHCVRPTPKPSTPTTPGTRFNNSGKSPSQQSMRKTLWTGNLVLLRFCMSIPSRRVRDVARSTTRRTQAAHHAEMLHGHVILPITPESITLPVVCPAANRGKIVKIASYMAGTLNVSGCGTRLQRPSRSPSCVSKQTWTK